MENAVDALKMAAAILIFIIAIASSFSLFGTAKQTADSIISMRDKQAYLETSEEKVGGILYTSSETIADGRVFGITTSGDRIVEKDDVISTIYRYSKEKYGVTIIKDKEVIARFDSGTESLMRQWHNIVDGYDITADEQKINYAERVKENISTKYLKSSEIELDLETLYEITVEGNTNINCGAPWYGNEIEIQKRIVYDLYGGKYENNGQTYVGKRLIDFLTGDNIEIIEITNEIDQSKYLEDNGQGTNLLEQYQMPTVEIIYILNN